MLANASSSPYFLYSAFRRSFKFWIVAAVTVSLPTSCLKLPCWSDDEATDHGPLMTSSYSAISQWSFVYSSILERSEIEIKPFSYAMFSSASSSKTNLVSPLRYAIGSNVFSITTTQCIVRLIVSLACIYNHMIAECGQRRTCRHHNIGVPFLVQPVVGCSIYYSTETVIGLGKNLGDYA